jgi:serine/threonine protein phosphatase PrpC
VPDPALHLEHADLSLLGNREENQDRVAIASADGAAFLAVVDGMGGHADGASAAEAAIRTMIGDFWEARRPLFDPEGFLHLTIGRAHESVVALGAGLPMEIRPRATCAACLIQGSTAYWAHVGDSRVYLLRNGGVATRTRDHSHVELLLRSGRITEKQAQEHPMRNYVESCIGGDGALPEMTLSGRQSLRGGDVLLLCSDGLWAGLTDGQISSLAKDSKRRLRDSLADIGARAVQATAPFADNTTAAAVRWLKEAPQESEH